MLLKAFNRTLIEDREKTYLTAAADVAATTITVAAVDSNSMADNDYFIIGEIGTENAEVMQINGAVSDGTSLTIDNNGSGGLRYAHAIGEPVYRILYNRVEFNRNSTDSTSGVTVLATSEIQPDDEFTRHEDTSNTTGFGFVRFNNETDATFSSYSDGVNYESTGDRSSRDPRTLWVIRKKVRQLLKSEDDGRLTDEIVDNAINDKQRDIAHLKLWSFYENERSLSAVANQFAYDIPSTVMNIYSSRFDTQTLVFINKQKWDILHWDTDTSTQDPSEICIWNRQLLFHPRPSDAAATTAINAGAGISATATSVTVDATSAFNRGDYYRFIIDSEVIYATNSTSTTFTGLLRGREGTTAATHADDAVITERDIVYNTHEEPADLIDTQERTAIPEPDALAYGAVIDLAPLVDKEDLIEFFELKYTKIIESLENKYAAKYEGSFGRVKYPEELMETSVRRNDPNQFPTNINV